MFVTMPQFEQFMPPNLVDSNQKYWRAVTLSLESPWYLFVYRAYYEGQMVPQTTLVAWETSLLEMLGGIPPANRIAIGRIEKEPSQGNRWELKWIEALWRAAESEVEETGALLLQLEGETQLRDVNLQPAPATGGRALLFSVVPPPVSTRASEPASSVPDDFPQPPPAGVVAGYHPKVGAIYRDGQYVDTVAEDRANRYDICNDLANQLIVYTERKREEHPNRPLQKLIAQVLTEIDKKRFQWNLSPAEAQWVAKVLNTHFTGR